ncbi:MAG: tetratricopeptide repeat protein [Cyanobacteria bacterium HKST-UBA06]|nr:tetratricopeptide repeat protein [Cyanobacteria bacterium HKST-UBA04]MCA9807608.1 tetratricopeptide repeat protein [Cyanobacteria bacterium HKST-UBA06]MCA9841227.1 tetratricopeptide repeat protein [Cyanobacteria bacterium HKST-UBA03]
MPTAFHDAFKKALLPSLSSEQSDSQAQVHVSRGDTLVAQFKDLKHELNTLPMAINEYTRARELDSNPDILAKLGRAHLLNGNLEQATLHLKRAKQQWNELSREAKMLWYENQAFIEFRSGRYKPAKAYLIEAIKLAPLWQRAYLHFSLAGVYLEALQSKGSINGWFLLVKHLMLTVWLFPCSNMVTTMITSLKVVAATRLAANQPEPEAEQTLQKIYTAYPGHPATYGALSRYYAKQNLFIQAEFWLSRSRQRFPLRDNTFHGLLELHQLTGNLVATTFLLQDWLSLRPRHADLQLLLSRALSEDPEQYDDAITMAKQALTNTNDPNILADIYFHLANLYTLTSQIEAAAMAYQATINLAPDSLEAYVHLGTLYYDMESYGLARQVFKQALAYSPDNARIYCNLGYLSWMQGDIEEAKQHYNQSIALDPGYDIALNNLGVLYLDHIGDMAEALRLFEQTLLFNPNYALCHYNKGRALSFLGQTLEAAECFYKAQALNVNSQELDNQDIEDRLKQLFESTE